MHAVRNECIEMLTVLGLREWYARLMIEVNYRRRNILFFLLPLILFSANRRVLVIYICHKGYKSTAEATVM